MNRSEQNKNLKQMYGRGTYINFPSRKDLEYIIKSCYGITDLHALKNLPKKNGSGQANLKTVYEVALSILNDNGLISPALAFRPLEDFNITNLEKAIFSDLIILSYFALLLPDCEDYYSLNRLPFASGLKPRVKDLESSAYGHLLGFRRPFHNLNFQKAVNDKRAVKSIPAHQDIKFVRSESPKGTGYHFEQYFEHGKYHINHICSTLVAALVLCHKYDPFIIRKPESELNNHSDNWQQFTDNFFSNTLGLKSSVPFEQIINPEYHATIEELMKSTSPILKQKRIYENAINLDSLQTFYKKLNSKIKEIINAPEKEKDYGSLGTEDKSPDEILLAEQTNAYLVEFLYGFKFCDSLVSSYSYFFTKKDLLKTVHTLSEFPFCNSRLQYLDLYADTFKTDYVYFGKTYSSHNQWNQHAMEYLIYTWERYMPALYYVFLYIYSKMYHQATDPLESYMKSNKKIFNFSVSRPLFKDKNTLSFYKLRKRDFLSIYQIEKPRKLKNYRKHHLYRLEMRLRKIRKNIF